MLEKLLKEEKVVGIKQTAKALNQNKINTLFVARDADKHLVEHIEEVAKAQDVKVIHVDSMKDLGKACGIDIGAAVAGLLH